jgi:hypothetical protein
MIKLIRAHEDGAQSRFFQEKTEFFSFFSASSSSLFNGALMMSRMMEERGYTN